MKTQLLRVTLLLLAMATTIPASGSSEGAFGHADSITSASSADGRTGPVMERY